MIYGDLSALTNSLAQKLSRDFGFYGVYSGTKRFYIKLNPNPNPNHNPEAIYNPNPSPKQSNSCLISLSRDQNRFLPTEMEYSYTQ